MSHTTALPFKNPGFFIRVDGRCCTKKTGCCMLWVTCLVNQSVQWYFSRILISCVRMNHRYILSAFHPRDFNEFDYESTFSCPSFFAFTSALPFKNWCFSWSLMLQEQRGDWSHISITLQKPLFFIRFGVAQTKTWLIPQQRFLAKNYCFKLGLMLQKQRGDWSRSKTMVFH